VEEHLRRVGLRIGAVVDRAHGELPGARVDRPAQRHHVADFQVVRVRELAADDRALAVAEERGQLVRKDEVIPVHVEVGARLDRELGEEVLRVLIDAGEPVRV
jgi:hypothetical protein